MANTVHSWLKAGKGIGGIGDRRKLHYSVRVKCPLLRDVRDASIT